MGVPSTAVPKLLVITLSLDKSISFFNCAVQMYFLSALLTTECIMLAAMAYDRYAAICKPLHYHTIMNMRFCICIAISCWGVGFINSSIHVPYTFQMPFCRSHHVNHFFCEVPALLKLSCQATWFHEVAMYISAFIVGLCSFLLTIISYVYIISSMFKIRSTQGRHKAFSTCTSHLIVVCVYYGTLIFMYLLPRSKNSSETDKTVSIIYTVVSPLLNPIIYSIRNNDIKDAIRGYMQFQKESF
ncbi:olfactory receptor 2T10 [Xenopus laevis]|nr:olfactory receptor 2T10 [Xenopus laevis]